MDSFSFSFLYKESNVNMCHHNQVNKGKRMKIRGKTVLKGFMSLICCHIDILYHIASPLIDIFFSFFKMNSIHMKFQISSSVFLTTFACRNRPLSCSYYIST